MGIQIFDERDPLSLSGDSNDSDLSFGVTMNASYIVPIRLDRLYLASTDTIDRAITLRVSPSGLYAAEIITVNVPAAAGLDPAIPPVEVISSLPNPPDGIVLAPGGTFILYSPTDGASTGNIRWNFMGGLL